jgi:hypothetical protein
MNRFQTCFHFNLLHYNKADYDILCEKKLERNEELIEDLFNKRGEVFEGEDDAGAVVVTKAGRCRFTPG